MSDSNVNEKQIFFSIQNDGHCDVIYFGLLISASECQGIGYGIALRAASDYNSTRPRPPLDHAAVTIPDTECTVSQPRRPEPGYVTLAVVVHCR